MLWTEDMTDQVLYIRVNTYKKTQENSELLQFLLYQVGSLGIHLFSVNFLTPEVGLITTEVL